MVHNLNADTAASALAVALRARKLVILTDVEGVYAQLAGLRNPDFAPDGRRPRSAAANPSGWDGAQDGGVPARGARRGRQTRTSLIEECLTRSCWVFTMPKDSEPWCVPGSALSATSLHDHGHHRLGPPSIVLTRGC